MAADVKVNFLKGKDQLTSALVSLGGGFGGLTTGIQAASAAAVALGAAAAGVAVGSIRAFASFDDAMTSSLSIMGDVTEDLEERMSDAARNVAKTTRFSATESAEAFYFLASAGLDASQSVEALDDVARFATAGAFDLSTATDLLTDAQSALGLSVDDTKQNMENMNRVSDVLVRANTLANASVEQFSSALTNKAAAAARAVGKDVEETTAVLAVLADQGTKGAEAGTQFSIVLRDLQTRAISNKEAFEQAGVAVFDAQGEMRNMGDIVSELETSLSGLSDEAQKERLIDMGFTDRSISALMSLLGASDDIREYESALRDAGGTTEEVATKQLSSFSAQIDLWKSKVVDVGITIGETLAPYIQNFLEKAEPYMDAFSEWLEEKIPSAIENAQPFVDDLKEKVIEIWESIREWWEEHGEDVRETLKGLGKIFKRVFQEAWPVVASIFNAVAAIAGWAFGLAADKSRESNESMRRDANRTNTSVSGFLHGMSQTARGIFDFIAAVFSDDTEGMKHAAQLFALGVINMFRNLLGVAANVFLAVGEAFANSLQEHFPKGARIVWDWIERVYNWFRDLPGRVAGALVRGLVNAFKDAIASVDRFLRGWKPAFPDLGGLNPFGNMSFPGFASGMAYVDKPTVAVVGEGKEGEFILTENQLGRLLSRFAGQRTTGDSSGGGTTINASYHNSGEYEKMVNDISFAVSGAR